MLFLLSLLLTMVVGVAFDFIFAALLTYVEGSAYIISRVRQALAVLLSGSVIPLALMPWGLGELLQWSPFASLASAPLRIYTGTGEPLLLIALQALLVRGALGARELALAPQPRAPVIVWRLAGP